MRLDLTGDNVVIRLCIRVLDIPLRNVSPNSVVAACDECDDPIWYDPTQGQPQNPETGEALVETHKLCFACFLLHSAAADEPPSIVLTEEQREALDREEEQ